MKSKFWKRTICSVLACSSLFYSLPLSSAADAETGASASETESTEPTEPPDDPVVSSTDAPAETTETATETILEEPDDDNISLGDLTGDGMIAVDDAVFVLTIYAKMAAGAEVNLTPNQFFCSDCNHDGKVDVTDAVLILEYYAKRAAGATELSFSDYIDQKDQQPETTTTTTETIPMETTTTVISIETTEPVTTEPVPEETTTTVQPTTTTTTTSEQTTTTTTTTTTTETTTTTTTEATTTTTTTTTTETTTTTTAKATTATTTTTTLPQAKQLSVNCILQNDSPSLPTGCEATALTIALQYDGFSAEKTDIAKTYLPKMLFYTLNNIYYGADFQYVFPGDPMTSYGYGCYAPAIVATANAYFTAQKNASYAENLSGTSFEDLFPYIAAGRPVVFWGTMGMRAPETGGSWTTPEGDTATWVSHEHCLVLTGYDKNAGTVSVADPLRGNVTYDLNLVAQRYNQMGKQAVIIHATTDSKTEAEGVLDDGIYRLRNAGSGLYMTVADGVDADERNLIQDAANGTAAQEFRISYDTDRNAYRLYTMCSSGGTNRVVDIVKLGGSVVSGCNAEIYRPVDAPAQTFVCVPQADGTMLFSCSTNRSACLAVWNTDTGTQGKTGFYDAGNVVIRNDNGDDLQRWILEPVE